MRKNVEIYVCKLSGVIFSGDGNQVDDVYSILLIMETDKWLSKFLKKNTIIEIKYLQPTLIVHVFTASPAKFVALHI